MNEGNDNTSFDLDAIIAEFSDPSAPPEREQGPATAEQSRRLVMHDAGDAIAPENMGVLSGLIDSASADRVSPQPEAQPLAKAEPLPAPAPEPQQAETVAEAAQRGMSEVELRALVDADERAEYAAAAAAEKPPAEETAAPPVRRSSPLVALLALIALRREQRKEAQKRDRQEAADAPEPPPDKAAKAYGARMHAVKRRALLATAMSLVSLYLSFAWDSILPLAGVLGKDLRVISLLLLILEITAVMAGLDLFTAGLLGFSRRKLDARSLIAVSCVLTMLDAAVTAALHTPEYGLPFCAVGALSITFGLWGDYFFCRAQRTGFRVLASSKSLYTVTGEQGIASGEVALLKARRSTAGFIRRSEEEDFGSRLYGTLTPFLLIASLVLGLLSSVAHGHASALVHCVAIIAAGATPFGCALCYAVPYSAAAHRLSQSGAAVAGWAGLQDAGKSHYVVITDADVFPKGTVAVRDVRLLEGSFTDKVISYTGSVIAASGSGLAGPFADLLRRNGFSISKVESFEPHDGGGMTAVVAGETVMVGSAAFMNLMGIRIPQRLDTRTSVYSAINGALVGIFVMEYTPTSSVQDALVMLLHSKLEPIFAIRDFNITPAMIKGRFKLPTDSFKFPSYSERFRISGAGPAPESRVAAVLAREGMGPLVEAAERGRRACLGVRAATAVAAAGSVFGLIILFLLCWTGAFDAASARNVITFMLLWLIPVAVVVLGMER